MNSLAETLASVLELIAPAARWGLGVVYFTLLGLIATYGLHRYWLVWQFTRHRRDAARPRRRFDPLPRVTVQLPLYNEGAVAERVIDAACRLAYPADRLQIQVLDDSDDGSEELARRRAALWAERGIDIQYLHRTDRTGFKAGALAHGLEHATGDLIAVFDADFVPPPAFLQRTVHFFTDPGVGMVQTRWEHLNREDSLLTRGQAIFLDGHFVIEHTARSRGGAWINFNGTGGLWRRAAIESAGGWQHDTLTEDVDLSYRAQLAGWRFLFLPRVTCPAELPPEINAFKSQQHRWTKGSIQTARKLLPRILRSQAPRRVKLEAFFHLTGPLVYLYLTLLALLFYPAIQASLRVGFNDAALAAGLGVTLLALGTVSASVFYLASQRALRRSTLATLAQIPMLMAIGIGMAVGNALACLEALLGHQSPFVRTPKYNVAPRPAQSKIKNQKSKIPPLPSLRRWTCALEIAMGFYMLACAHLSLQTGHYVVSLPFLMLFASGYFYVGLTSLWTHLRAARHTRTAHAAHEPTPTP